MLPRLEDSFVVTTLCSYFVKDEEIVEYLKPYMKINTITHGYHQKSPWIKNGKRQIFGERIQDTMNFPTSLRIDGLNFPLWYKGKKPFKMCQNCKKKALCVSQSRWKRFLRIFHRLWKHHKQKINKNC